jgi:hypothetical protein
MLVPRHHGFGLLERRTPAHITDARNPDEGSVGFLLTAIAAETTVSNLMEV